MEHVGQDEERKALLRAGWEWPEDAEAQARFLRDFPLPEAPDSQSGEALANLAASADPAVRRKAARRLSSVAAGDWTRARGDWLTDPRTVQAMLSALSEQDEKARLDLVRALGFLSQRYHFKDARIRRTLLERYEQAPAAERIAIAKSVAHFDAPDTWRLVVNAASERPAKSAQHMLGLAVARYGAATTDPVRSELSGALVRASGKQRNGDVIHALVLGFEAVGDAGVMETLASLRVRVDSEPVRETIERVMGVCGARQPSRAR